jgi:hypothetical protein
MNMNGHESENGLTRIFANLKPESIRVNLRNSRLGVAFLIRVHPSPSVVEIFP